jgi:hypothetical protein
VCPGSSSASRPPRRLGDELDSSGFESGAQIDLVGGEEPRGRLAILEGCNSGELRNIRTAAKLKAMGVQRRWPDLVLFDPTGRLHAIELKREGESLSEHQEGFQQWAISHGVPHSVSRSVDETLVVLDACCASRWGATDDPEAFRTAGSRRRAEAGSRICAQEDRVQPRGGWCNRNDT